MKTELVAKWIIVEGHLQVEWSEKDNIRIIHLNRFSAKESAAKAA
jgi:hypothetical protein